MNRENQVELVRTLTREVLKAGRPEKLGTFAEDFTAFALSGGIFRAEESLSQYQAKAQSLDTTLVAGMFFQVLHEAEKLPSSTMERVSFIRHQAKNYLATRLAGQITLSQFFRLLNLIEEHVQHYFEHSRENWLGGKVTLKVAAPPSPPQEAIRIEELRQSLEALPLIPKGRRKLTTPILEEFLLETQGDWFRLLDFEARFRVNKKTAWAYLNNLLQAGILEHNGEKANKVRYSVAKDFQR